jgi:hypothetical protein
MATMHAASLLARARVPVGMIVIAMLALGLVFPALANPVALGLGVTVGVAFAFRGGIPFDAPRVRLVLVILGLVSVALVWLSVQPGYVGA